MNSLFTLLIVGFFIYMMFFRKGGMGCCGGHHDHHSDDSRHRDSAMPINPPAGSKENIIDLKKKDYQVISDGEDLIGHNSH